MAELKKLRECPFCGGEADYSKDGISDMDGKPMWWVECPVCGISTSGNYERQPEVDAWNSRTSDAVPVVRCRECKHYQTDVLFNHNYCCGRLRTPDDYCSYGERP